MHSLLPLLLGIPLKAVAAAEQLGSGPGIAGMWKTICDTLPFCGGGRFTFVVAACKIVTFIWGTIGAAAVCFIIYGGIKLIVSQGESVDSAKKIITHAAIGLVLALLSGAAIALVIGIVSEVLGGQYTGVFLCFS